MRRLKEDRLWECVHEQTGDAPNGGRRAVSGEHLGGRSVTTFTALPDLLTIADSA